MEAFFSMVEVQAALFLYFIVGIFARRREILTGPAVASMVEFLLKIALPCMVFQSFNQDLTWSRLTLAAEGVAVGVCVNVFSLLLGSVLFRRVPREKRSILRYSTLVSNAGFAGFPLVSAAFGQEALFYASVFIIPLRITMWSAGVGMFTDQKGRGKLRSVLLNPGIVAVELGLLRMLTGIHLPGALNTAVQSIGDTTAPLSMILIGAMLAHVNVRRVVERSVLFLSALRLLIIPGALFVVLRLIRLDPVIANTAVVLMGMPAGVNTALLAQRYGADTEFASKCVFVTTVLSLVSVPVLTLLF